MLELIRRRRILGLVLVVVGPLIVGVSLSYAATHVVASTSTDRRTITLTDTLTDVHRRTVTVRVPATVVRKVDRVLVVRTPRYVFRYRGRRRVIPAHIVRVVYRPATSSTSPPIAAVLGVEPTPETVTVPITVTVPGPTTTVTSPAQTVTQTVTSATTVTVVVTDPLADSR